MFCSKPTQYSFFLIQYMNIKCAKIFRFS
uniref:Uncharacterized protein n=1 Tax=Rhizophora mucronata TaxID=61149 RepID=A0A2P2QJJ5_RHIMU